MAEALRYFRSENMWLAGGLMSSHAAEYNVMRRAGYLPCPERFASRLFWFAFRLHGKKAAITPGLSSRIKVLIWRSSPILDTRARLGSCSFACASNRPASSLSGSLSRVNARLFAR